MARLTTLKPTLTTMRPALQAPKDEAGRSRYKRKDKGHSLYDSRRWRGSGDGTNGLRWRVLLDARFTCRMCGRLEVDDSQLVADHIVPHRGDPCLFFDRANLQCLCKACHDSAKQREERRGG